MRPETFFEKFDGFIGARGSIKKVRQLVLKLATRGMLVPQRSTDEPVAALLSSIAQFKQDLSPSRNLCGPVVITPISPSDRQGDLPEGWVLVRLGDVTISRDSERIPISSEERSSRKKIYDYYGASGIIDQIDGYLFDKPLLLIGEDGANLINRSTPIAFIARGKYWVNNHAHVLDGLNEAYIRFLEIQINSIDLAPYITGTAQPKMNQARLNAIPIALPPMEEQERIVAKVDELMAVCDRLEAEQKEWEAQHTALTRAAIARFNEAPTPANLNFLFHPLYSVTPADLRKIILNLALRGKLVPQDPAEESVKDLVQRIDQERSAVRARVYPVVDPSEAPFEIPLSWSWVRLGNIALHSDSGWSPQCGPHAREGDAWGVLKVSAVSWGRFLPEENKALPIELCAREECEVRAGDFLVSRANTEDLVARSVVVTSTPPHLMLSDKIVRFAFPDCVDKRFVNLVNSASSAREYYSRKASGTSSSMKNVGRDVMSNLPVPLPPLVEQRRIVAKTDALFELLSDIEGMSTSSRLMADDLGNAIVGELVKAGGK